MFDPKTAIVKPFIANYINQTLKQLKTESELFHHSDLQKAWEQYNPEKACKIISILSVNNLNHSEALQTKMCLSCSPLLNPTSDLLPSSSKQCPIRSNRIPDILQIISDLQLNISHSNIIDLIDYNLNELDKDIFAEKLSIPATKPNEALAIKLLQLSRNRRPPHQSQTSGSWYLIAREPSP